MGDKGERGVKNLKKWVTSLWTAPVLYYFMKSMSKFKTKNFRQDASDIKKEVEKNKGILIEALAKKGCALRILGQLDDATEVLFKLLKFTEVTDSKVILFAISQRFMINPSVHFVINTKRLDSCRSRIIYVEMSFELSEL